MRDGNFTNKSKPDRSEGGEKTRGREEERENARGGGGGGGVQDTAVIQH